jgi:biopolymer transport protein ExbD
MNAASKLAAAIVTVLVIAACSPQDPPAVPVVSALSVSIDANNNCTLEKARIECRQVADIIKTRYPTSKPRVDICLDKQARYEAAVEVMNSVSAAGFTVGTLDCPVASG